MSKPPARVLVVGAGVIGGLFVDRLKQNDAISITVVTPRQNSTTDGLRHQDRWFTPDLFHIDIECGAAPYDMVVFALKPDILDGALGRYVDAVDETTTIVLTAAGKDTVHANKHLANGRHLSFVRIMVNTPMQIGRGVIAVYAADDIDPKHIERTRSLFSETDLLYRVAHEAQMHAATASTGSGPGFVFDYFARRERSGVDRQKVIDDFHAALDGFSLPNAHQITDTASQDMQFIGAYRQAVIDLDFVKPECTDAIIIAMMAGTLALARQVPDPFATLRDRVTSKGGTTEAGLAAWNACSEGNIGQCVQVMIRAAFDRSLVLARSTC